MPKQNVYYETICDQIRNIKFKYWTPPEEEKKDVTKEITDELKKTNINFYKGDIKSTFEKKDRKIACIGFPKESIYAGYVWFYPVDWIRENKDNPEKRWLSIKDKFKITIIKSVKNASGKYVNTDEKEITPEELKEAMKRGKKN